MKKSVCVVAQRRSVDFLAPQSECVQHVSALGACLLWEECEELPVEEGQQGLVACCPHSVPRAVEGVGHSWTKHVVQIDLRHLKVEQREHTVLAENLPNINQNETPAAKLDNEVL